MEKLYLECQCDCAEHTVRVTSDPSDGDVIIEVHLRQWRAWHKRLWIAIKYAFGHQSSFGAFDCTILRKEDYPKLRSLLDLSEQVTVSNVREQV